MGETSHLQPSSTVGRHTAVFTRPPSRVPSNRSVDGPLLGNGDVGVVVAGAAEEQVFFIGKNDFWSQHSTRPLPLGQVRIRIPALAGAKYRQEQDLEHAAVRGLFAQDRLVLDLKLQLRSWVAATENLLVTEITAESPTPVAVEVELAVQTGLRPFVEHYYDAATHTAGSQEMTTAYPISHGCGRGVLWATRKADPAKQPGRHAALVTRVFGVDAACRSTGPGRSAASFALQPGETVLIVTAVLSDLDAESPLTAAKKRVRQLRPTAVAELHRAHTEWWQRFWAASCIELGDKQVEAYWYGALYMLACCNRAGKMVPGLWGNWVTTDVPMWHADFHLNYNLQTPYYGVYACNHPELADPYYDTILAYVPKGRDMARVHGWPGVHFPVAIGPDGMTVEDTDFGQRSNAVFCALNFITHYEHTQDLEFLRHKAYPFLLEVAAFWEAYLRRDETGRYVIAGSNFTERPDAGQDINSVIDLSLVRTLFRALVAASDALGADPARRARWQDILEHLSPLPTRTDGGKLFLSASENWQPSAADSFGHAAWAIWPGGCVCLGSEPRLVEAAHNHLAAMPWRGNHPQVYCQGVRAGYAPTLGHLKDTLTHDMYPNYYIEYVGGGVEMCGILMAINELLLQSHDGLIRLFPVWPKVQPARFNRLRAVGAFLVSSELKDGVVQGVTIESAKGKTCTLLNPWLGRSVQLQRAGRTAEVLTGERIAFATAPGERIDLAPAVS